LVIWPVVLLLVAVWPPAEGSSLGFKIVGWAVDPLHKLPVMPPDLPVDLGDDGFAVAQHDDQMAAYYYAFDGSSFNRIRMEIRDFENPFDPTTERQLLVALAAVAALLVWRMDAGRDARR
jgi:hypothetical protein